MSQQALEAILGRALLDRAFREDLFADPDALLAPHELTPTERLALMRMDAESLDACAGLLARVTGGPATPAESAAAAAVFGHPAG